MNAPGFGSVQEVEFITLELLLRINGYNNRLE